MILVPLSALVCAGFGCAKFNLFALCCVYIPVYHNSASSDASAQARSTTVAQLLFFTGFHTGFSPAYFNSCALCSMVI